MEHKLNQVEIDFVDFVSTLHDDTKSLFMSTTGTIFTIKVGQYEDHEEEDLRLQKFIIEHSDLIHYPNGISIYSLDIDLNYIRYKIIMRHDLITVNVL